MRKLAASVFGKAALKREGSVLIVDFSIPECDRLQLRRAG